MKENANPPHNAHLMSEMRDGPLTMTPPDLSTMKEGGRGVFISTYGCQMNVNDTERMFTLLEMQNFYPVDKAEDASLIIINTCSVREKPVHKVYSEVGKYRKLKQQNPHLRIGVGGCVGQQEKENLVKTAPLIDFVFGTDAIDLLPQIVAEAFEGKDKVISTRQENHKPYHIETLVRSPGFTTFVNITKGCDNFCSFCIVPFTRGRERSRPLDHLLADVKKLVARGVKEVTLLGQNVNSYESECGADFAQLLRVLATQTKVERLRFTTSHPKDFNQELVEVMRDHQDKICEYIHLPFQSGNTRILELMNRGYSREEYLAKIEMIKKTIPNVVFSTDVIVGFPGETEEEFMDSVSLIKEVGFETIFSFKYSPRPFTKAAQFKDQVDEEVKSRRLTYLQEEHRQLADRLVKKYEGQVLKILVEGYDIKENRTFGRSTQNKLVNFVGTAELVGQTVSVKITRAHPNTMRGELSL